MAKPVSILMLLVMVFSLSACKASKSDLKKAGDFITGLAAFKTADPISDMAALADFSASVITLPSQAFDFKKGWNLKDGEYAKYAYIFNADTTLSIDAASDQVNKVSYTFCVHSDRDIYNSADKLISIYGAPLYVYLNGAASSHSEVGRAAEANKDPKLTYAYIWPTQLQGQSLYVYEVFYDASGINFTYIIISNHLDTTNKLWK